ncbi:MAG: tetratricopeptide repeat protein [Deltaproteobacteria bacterium]|nr:tetratricopeptide repeat protein [Deltaproteobacteria bacterium]
MNLAVKKTGPTLALCMIVKNEEAWLRACLQSVQGLVDEMVIVDTGSSDATVEIAKSFGARMISHVWKNDFSEARNVSLAHASSDWILVLDADEAISRQDHDPIRQLLLHPQKPIITLIQTSYCLDSNTCGWRPNQLQVPEAKGYPGYMDSSLARLFPRDPQIRFQGEIHEHARHEKQEYPQINVPLRIHHYGKYNSQEVLRKKDELYLGITEEKYRKASDNAHVCYEMAAQYWRMGEVEKAKEVLQKALKIDPKYVRLWLVWGGILHQEKKYAEAAKAYAQVMELEPSNPTPYLYLPTILVEMKNFVLAQEILNEGRQKIGDHPGFYLNEGSVKQSLGKHKEALLSFSKALTLNPDESIAWLNQGVSELYLGFFAQAEKSFEKAEQYSGTRFEANRRLVHLYFKTAQLEKAALALKKAKEEQSEHPEILVNEVVLLTEQKQWTGLVEKIEVLQERPDLSHAQQLLLKKCSSLIPSPQFVGETTLHSLERSNTL